MKKISSNEWLLIATITLYTLSTTMVSTFANVFLLEYTSSLVTMSIYSIFRYGMMGVAAFFAAKLTRKLKLWMSSVIGLILVIVSVFGLLVFENQFESHRSLVYLIGALWGCGEGFYWISTNTLIQTSTKIETRAKFLGYHGALLSIATIIAPVLSTVIFFTFTLEQHAYYFMFILAIILYFIIAILLTRIKEHNENSDKKFYVGRTFMKAKTDHKWRYVLVSQFVWGLRDSAIISLTGLLIFKATGNTETYSKWLSIFAVIAMIANYYVGQTLNNKNLKKYITMGSFGLFASGLFLVVLRTPTGAFMHGFLQNCFLAFVSTPFAFVAMNVVSSYAKDENILGRTLAREITTAIARSVGLLVVVLMNQLIPGESSIYISMLVIYCFCLVFWAVQMIYLRPKNQLLSND